MKNHLLLKPLIILLALLFGYSVSAQVYHFQEGFVTNAPPAGWITNNVAWSSTHNHNLFNGLYSAKLKPNESFLVCKAVNTADELTFWCKVRDTTASTNFHLMIEKSTDKQTWTQISKDPFNKADTGWQVISVNVNDNSAELYIRFYATAQGGTASLGLCYVDDISVTKLEVSPSDATLTDLTFNGASIEGFTATTMFYDAEVPYFVDQIMMGGVPNNPAATLTITNPVNLRGNELERTGKVTVKAPDGVTTKTYQIVFTVSKFIYYTGFVTTGSSIVPFDGWTTGYTYTSTTIPMGNHGYFDGPAAFRFIRGQPDKVGYLNTAKYVKSDTLGFWLAVDQGDGVEQMLIEKRVMGGVRQTIANLKASDMSPDWQEFKYAIKENDSCEIIFTPTITPESAVTRIYIDDLYLTGKPVIQGVEKHAGQTSFTVSPNPSTNHIVLSTGSYRDYQVTILDLTGRKVYEASFSGTGIFIDTRKFTPGVYFVSCSSGTNRETSRFIKL